MADLVNAISGKDGDAFFENVQFEITEWSADSSLAEHDYASNLTANMQVTVTGVEKLSGSFTCVIPTAGLPLALGAIGTLVLYGPVSMTVEVVLTSHPIACDINEGAPTMVQYTFRPRGRPIFTGFTSSA